MQHEPRENRSTQDREQKPQGRTDRKCASRRCWCSSYIENCKQKSKLKQPTENDSRTRCYQPPWLVAHSSMSVQGGNRLPAPVPLKPCMLQGNRGVRQSWVRLDPQRQQHGATHQVQSVSAVLATSDVLLNVGQDEHAEGPLALLNLAGTLRHNTSGLSIGWSGSVRRGTPPSGATNAVKPCPAGHALHGKHRECKQPAQEGLQNTANLTVGSRAGSGSRALVQRACELGLRA